MKQLNNIMKTLAALLCGLIVCAACTDGNDWETDASKAALFRVSNITVTPSAQTASVSWTASQGAEYYVIEVSTEPLSDDIAQGTGTNSIVFGEDKSITSTPAVIKGLTKETEYYIRVKAYGGNLQSAWSYKDGSFETTEENILENGVDDNGITGTTIQVAWDTSSGLPVTHLVYEYQVSAGDDVTTQTVTHDFTEEEKTAGTALLTDLQAGTHYVIYIYNDEDLRGMTEATTEQIMSAINEEDIVGGNVTLHWNSNGRIMTHYGYVKAGESEAVKVALTETDLDASQVTVEGLELGTEYTFYIYNESSIYGAAKTTTEQILNIEDQNITGSAITATWTANGKNVTYLTYQADNEEEAASHELTTEEISAGQATLTGLRPLTNYTIRIYGDHDVLRGISTARTKENKIDLSGESTISSVTFTWEETDADIYSYGYAAGSEPSTGDFVLTSEELQARSVTVNGLESNTAYTFVLFDKEGNKISNPTTFTTKVNPLAGYDVRTISSGSDFTNILNDSEASGNIAVLIPVGTTIEGISNLIIPARITSLLIWGGNGEEVELEDSAKPSLRVQRWDVEGDKTQIEFYNLNIDGNGNYAFRLGENATVGTIERFEFVSCNISNLSGGGLVSMRDAGASAAHIRNIVFDDCNIKDVGNYSLVHSESSASTSQVDNISMSNTTASGFTRCIIRLDQSATVNIKIDHCTFYDSNNTNNGSGYWLRLSNSATPSVSVTNTLFGKCMMTTSPSGLAIQSENVFHTSDCSGTAGTWTTAISTDSNGLFKAPASGDFTVTDSQYAAYGDSRWNQ